MCLPIFSTQMSWEYSMELVLCTVTPFIPLAPFSTTAVCWVKLLTISVILGKSSHCTGSSVSFPAKWGDWVRWPLRFCPMALPSSLLARGHWPVCRLMELLECLIHLPLAKRERWPCSLSYHSRILFRSLHISFWSLPLCHADNLGYLSFVLPTGLEHVYHLSYLGLYMKLSFVSVRDGEGANESFQICCFCEKCFAVLQPYIDGNVWLMLSVPRKAKRVIWLWSRLSGRSWLHPVNQKFKPIPQRGLHLFLEFPLYQASQLPSLMSFSHFLQCSHDVLDNPGFSN